MTVIVLFMVMSIAGVYFLGPMHGWGHKEMRKQALCQANLSAIGKAIAMYSAASNDRWAFPLLRDQGDPNASVSASTSSNTTPFDPALGENAMQNVWPLIQDGSIGIAAFHCPADTGWTKPSYAGKFGWTDKSQFSYGLHWPYDGDPAGRTNPARLSDPKAAPELAIFTDRNPGGSVNQDRRQSNHPKDGQAVLRRDTAVRFYNQKRDSLAGYNADDVYVNSVGTAGGIPADRPGEPGSGAWDTSICPVPSR